MTNREIAREFCEGAFKKTFNLSNERTEAYVEVIAELLDFAVENAKQDTQ